MLIIVDGPDGHGKSTLVEQLADLVREVFDHKVTVLHREAPKQFALDEYEVPLWNYRPGEETIICDRWHIGESVYPNLLGRPSVMGEESRWHIEMFLLSRGAYVINCQRSLDDVLTTHARRKDPQWQVDNARAAINAFNIACTNSMLPTTRYRPTRDVYTRMRLMRLISNARSYDANAQHISKYTTYIGRRWPAYLILGDVRAGHELYVNPADDNRPVFVPRRDTSGYYLLNTMLRNRFHWLEPSKYGFANACDVDDVEKLWIDLERPTVVTLGNNAHKALEKLKIPHGAVTHPQYVRRFHHSKQDAYAHALSAALETGEDKRSWLS